MRSNFPPNSLVTPAPAHPYSYNLNRLVADAEAAFRKANDAGDLDPFGEIDADINALPELGDLVWRAYRAVQPFAIYFRAGAFGKYTVVAEGPVGIAFEPGGPIVERIYHDL